MKTIINFIMRSSEDPRKTSLTIKAALLGIISYLLQVTELACRFGEQCYDIDPSLWEVIGSSIADGTFYLLSLVAVFGTLWGAIRKLYRTFTGQNRALW